jgi:ribosome-associated protein
MSDAGSKQLVAKIAQFIADHKGIDPIVIDVSSQAGWTDYFIVATVMSLGHLKGVTRELWGIGKVI